MAVKIRTYAPGDQDALVELILDIQQNEFQVPVTIAQQPDLLNIQQVYGSNKGNFWVATEGDDVVGTIGLIDIGNKQAALRKMFVHKDFRGKEKGVGQLLLDALLEHCAEQGIDEVYLGTVGKMQAAHRFYLRNGFTELQKDELPPAFPVMPVDHMFFGKKGILSAKKTSSL